MWGIISVIVGSVLFLLSLGLLVGGFIPIEIPIAILFIGVSIIAITLAIDAKWKVRIH